MVPTAWGTYGSEVVKAVDAALDVSMKACRGDKTQSVPLPLDSSEEKVDSSSNGGTRGGTR